MMKKERTILDLFDDMTHGQVVSTILKSNGQPDELLFCNVDNMRGAVDSDRYLNALAQTKHTLEKRPGDRVVVNISLGSHNPKTEETQLIKDILGLGAIVVAAAGNDGAKESTYPAALDGVICVGASAHGIRREYSNYGDVDIFADGAYRTTETAALPSNMGVETHSRTVTLNGTSFAAPRVSGVIVKMLRLNPSFETAQILEILQKTSDNVIGFEPGAMNRLNALAEISVHYALLKTTRHTFFMGLQVVCMLVVVCAGLLILIPMCEFLFRVLFPNCWVTLKQRRINRIMAAHTKRPRAIRYLIDCLFPGYTRLFESASSALLAIGEAAVPELIRAYPYKPCNEFGDFAACIHDLIGKIGGREAQAFLRAEQARKDDMTLGIE
ncbi:MAG: S8 family serine peptidase [Phycisphaerae bacterium]|nr:S8 family serine peptidase [Phycisphaerae bacterium]